MAQRIVDTHLHTRFSSDGEASLDEYCRLAVERGVAGVCFTEHLDADPADPSSGFFQAEAFFTAIGEARRRYAGSLEVLAGIEVTEPHRWPASRETVRRTDFDFVLGSVHTVQGRFVGEPGLFAELGAAEFWRLYHEDVLEMIESGGFDALAHLDFPARFVGAHPAYGETHEGILKALVERGIALEVNTSGLRKGLDQPLPAWPVVERYAALGGRCITIASDAHRLRDFNTGWETVAARVATIAGLEAGFFRGRRFVRLTDAEPLP